MACATLGILMILTLPRMQDRTFHLKAIIHNLGSEECLYTNAKMSSDISEPKTVGSMAALGTNPHSAKVLIGR